MSAFVAENSQSYSSRLPETDDDSEEYITHSTLVPRRRSKTGGAISAASRRAASTQGTDIDPPLRHRRKSKHVSRRQSDSSHIRHRDPARQRSPDSDHTRYAPRLDQIVEATDIRAGSEHTYRPSSSRSTIDHSTSSRHRHRNDISPRRRTVPRRTEPSSAEIESELRVSPSLLSVLSTLTGVSEQTSSSNHTVTQQSYDQAHGVDPATSSSRSHLRDAEASAMSDTQSTLVNVFDYMEEERSQYGRDDGTEVASSSSSSSHYEASDGNLSEAPGSPSSQSTVPSPANTRNGSINGGSAPDLRRKYDQYATPDAAAQTSGVESSLRGEKQQPIVKYIAGDQANDAPRYDMAREVDLGEHRQPVSRSSERAHYYIPEGFRPERESLPNALAYSHYDYAPRPDDGQYRSRSTSSAGSTRSQQPQAHSHSTALQSFTYQPTAPAPPLYQPPAAHSEDVRHLEVPPRAPEAPSIGQRNIVGYEKLALELANAHSAVQPLYRKFDYLNHRILLHLQDEISELEEQLRHLDQLIAQYSQPSREGTHLPASRRGEEYFGSPMHHGRKELLGRIFLKLEQYNRAMSAYGSMNLDSRPAEAAQVARYRAWMQTHAPIHEGEVAFLLREEDLISPGQRPSPQSPAGSAPAPATSLLSWLPAAVLFMPLFLIATMPSVGTRIAVTILLALAVSMLAMTTHVGSLMPARDWLLCGATYTMLMIAVAGLVPSYKT